MSRYFDYSDWDIEEVCNHIRERIFESKKTIPPKVMKHFVSIVYRTGESCYSYGCYGLYSYGRMPEFETREDAEKFLDKCAWITKLGDNFWVEDRESRSYDTKDGKTVLCHYEIRESDYEVYEDGGDYIEYTDEEKKQLSDILYIIEKARVCMSVYDHCCDQGSLGGGSFSEELKEELDKFEKDFSEDLPEGWFDSDDD